MKQLLIKILKAIIISFSFLLFNITCVHADEIEVTKFTPDNMNYTISDGKLELNCSINDEGNYEVHGDMNTEGLDEGYYTSYIYENKNSDWSNYDGASFHIENMGEGSIDLNFSIICSDGSRFNVSKKNAMLVKRENSSIIERVHLPYGAVNINKGFIGTIYIPFQSLDSEDTEGGTGQEKSVDSIKNNLSKISSWGISVTCRENESRHFKISDFSLVNSNQDFNSYLKSNFVITGDDNIVIPEAGEYVYQYKVDDSKAESQNIFSVSDNFDGVKMSEDGLLTVGYNAEPQIITITALQDIDDNRGVGETKSINLVRSWSHYRKYEDGVSMAVPNEENYSMAVKPNNPFMNRKITIIVRLLALGIICGSMWICYTWFWLR
ncbi:MAG: hypothetical protein Q4F66_01675 [Clostridium sp.]|nr:hypothetical protein [Clostridium sp.]